VRVNCRILVVYCLLVSFAGCATAGPRAIRQGRFNYNQAISNTRSEQMLANLVRLRYRDPPFFLDVASVSTQYVLSADAPSNALVRVRYRDAWFYIDDSDLDSKSTFTLLDTLFQLQAGGAQGGVPLLTLPVGGR